MSHTPKPWSVGADTIFRIDSPPEEDGILEIFEDDNGVPSIWVPNRDDRTLIEAAPDLLEACKRQVANIERWLETGVPADAEESRSIYEQLVAAIAKAEGKG